MEWYVFIYILSAVCINYRWFYQGSTFGTTSELFKNTIGKLGTMLNTGGSNHMFYLIGFIVFLFILLYYLMGRK